MVIDNIEPVDYTNKNTYCRIYGWLLPWGTDTVQSGAGLEDFNDLFDAIDLKLNSINNHATPAPSCFTGVWKCAGTNVTQSLASSGTIANATLSYSNVFTATGTPTPTFNTTTGEFSLGTEGYWRITYTMYATGSSPFTEGYLSVALKDASLSTYPVRSLTTVPIETYAGETQVHKSVLYRVGTTGNCDMNPSTTYILSAFQENNVTGSVTIGSAETWISIEYVRPL